MILKKDIVNGEEKNLLVHRKGATRAFAPGHPEIPKAYQNILFFIKKYTYKNLQN